MRKVVEEPPFEDTVGRGVEHADFERIAADDDDAGDVRQLADGSVSIAVPESIRAELRREVVEVDVDPEAAHRVHVDERPPEA